MSYLISLELYNVYCDFFSDYLWYNFALFRQSLIYSRQEHLQNTLCCQICYVIYGCIDTLTDDVHQNNSSTCTVTFVSVYILARAIDLKQRFKSITFQQHQSDLSKFIFPLPIRNNNIMYLCVQCKRIIYRFLFFFFSVTDYHK